MIRFILGAIAGASAVYLYALLSSSTPERSRYGIGVDEAHQEYFDGTVWYDGNTQTIVTTQPWRATFNVDLHAKDARTN